MNYSKLLSKRIAEVSRVGSRETGDLIANAGINGVDCIKLSGFPPGQPGDNVIEAAERAVHNNGKADSRGLAILRNAIAEKVKREDNFSADPESEILVTNGAMFALHLIMTAFIDKGDEVLIPAPSFFFDGLVHLTGGRICYVQCEEKNNFRWNVKSMKENITSSTKMIIVNSPCNPTGYVPGRELLLDIAELVEKRDIIVLSDESYQKLVYDGKKHISFSSLPGMKKRTITVQSFTKSYSMPHWRVGYLIAPAPILEKLHLLLEWMVLECNYIAQAAAAEAMTGEQTWIADITRQFEKNRNILYEGISHIEKIHCIKPEAGPFIFLNVSEIEKDVNEISRLFIEKYGIPNTPGPIFKSNEHLRIPFGAKQEDIKRLISRLETAVREISEN